MTIWARNSDYSDGIDTEDYDETSRDVSETETQIHHAIGSTDVSAGVAHFDPYGSEFEAWGGRFDKVEYFSSLEDLRKRVMMLYPECKEKFEDLGWI